MSSKSAAEEALRLAEDGSLSWESLARACVASCSEDEMSEILWHEFGIELGEEDLEDGDKDD